MCKVITEETKSIENFTESFSEIVENYENGKIDKDKFLFKSSKVLHSSIFDDITYQFSAYKFLSKILIKSFFTNFIAMFKA